MQTLSIRSKCPRKYCRLLSYLYKDLQGPTPGVQYRKQLVKNFVKYVIDRTNYDTITSWLLETIEWKDE